MAQLKLHYMYRDGANWKESDCVIFANAQNLSAEGVQEMIEECLFDDGNFIAESIGLPTLYFDDDSAPDAHGLHEFLRVDECDFEPNDKQNRDVLNLVIEFARQRLFDWKSVRNIL